jgi:hypothetical protein
MNAKEGLRRLSILFGASGALLGGFLAYPDGRNLYNTYSDHRRFEGLMASATMQKVAQAARDYQSGPWTNYRDDSAKLAYVPTHGHIEIEVPARSDEFGWVPVGQTRPPLSDADIAAYDTKSM